MYHHTWPRSSFITTILIRKNKYIILISALPFNLFHFLPFEYIKVICLYHVDGVHFFKAHPYSGIRTYV
jgi:hypothetical protein